jgi:hypothetical protein
MALNLEPYTLTPARNAVQVLPAYRPCISRNPKLYTLKPAHIAAEVLPAYGPKP